MTIQTRTASVIILSIATAAVAATTDWPTFRGASRDAICREHGLLKDWSSQQPALDWQVKGLGKGYSSVAIVGNALYSTGDRGGEQLLVALDLNTRKELWTAKLGRPWSDGGCRSTPTVDGQKIYALGTHGDLVCADTATGREIWRKSYAKDFGGKMMSGWGFTESPLLDGDRLICTPGGADAMMVALDKNTGDVIWKCAAPKLGPKGRDGAAYSSIVATDVGGIRQYVTLTVRGAIGVRAKDGKYLWGYNRVINETANITTPIVTDDMVFVSTSYNTGSALLKLTPDGEGGVTAKEVYFLDGKTFQNHHGGVVLVDGYLYGGHGQNAGLPMCIEMKTGKIMWKAPKAVSGGSAAVLYADGNLIFRYEQAAEVALIAASPEGYSLKGTFKSAVDDGPAWAHPVIHDGKLYLRTNDNLMCYNLAAR